MEPQQGLATTIAGNRVLFLPEADTAHVEPGIEEQVLEARKRRHQALKKRAWQAKQDLQDRLATEFPALPLTETLALPPPASSPGSPRVQPAVAAEQLPKRQQALAPPASVPEAPKGRPARAAEQPPKPQQALPPPASVLEGPKGQPAGAAEQLSKLHQEEPGAPGAAILATSHFDPLRQQDLQRLHTDKAMANRDARAEHDEPLASGHSNAQQLVEKPAQQSSKPQAEPHRHYRSYEERKRERQEQANHDWRVRSPGGERRQERRDDQSARLQAHCPHGKPDEKEADRERRSNQSARLPASRPHDKPDEKDAERKRRRSPSLLIRRGREQRLERRRRSADSSPDRDKRRRLDGQRREASPLTPIRKRPEQRPGRRRTPLDDHTSDRDQV